MFTSYIKSLNDMVYSTSETPEEQPSTGVLGRIGSWFSPWRGRGPKSPTENASPTVDPSLSNPEGEKEEEESQACVRGQQWEDKNPDPQAPFRDCFPPEGEDATQSAHRDGSVVSSTGTAGGGGGPKEEEPVGRRAWRRTGQGPEREERGNGASASGNPEQNATHLTHLSTSCKQGVAWDSDQAHAQPQAHRRAQAQAGSQLRVYLEETSVIHCGQDASTEKEVFRTTVTKSLHVLPKFKSSSCSDSQDNSAEEKETHVTRSGCHSSPERVSQKSHKDSQSESESDRDQTEADSMGRKNTSKRRSRKNSQEDGGNTPQGKAPENPPPASDGTPSLEESATGSQGKSPGTHVGKESGDSTSKLSSASPASPEGGEKKTPCPDAARELDQFQDSNSVTAATWACAVAGAANMEEDSLYRVERKTETPESKRRSMKVSRSEVKLFRKYVPLNPKQSPAGDVQEVIEAGINTTKDDKKDRRQLEVDGSPQASKKAGDGSKPAVGRLADKINVFEQQQATVGGHQKTLRAPKSADVSPVRVKAGFVLSDQRSRSADRYGVGRSPSASPTREKLMTISERVKVFAEPSVSRAKPALPQKPAMIGMPQRSAPSAGNAPTKSPKLDNQGELDPQKQTRAVSAAIKAGGQDGTAGGVVISTAKLRLADSQTKEAGGTEPAGRGPKALRVKTDAAAEDRDDSAELSPRPKNLSRTGSRSKRRKSKEPSSPINPNYQNKPECLTSKPGQVDYTEESIAEKPSLPPRKVQENAAEKKVARDTEQKALQRESKESEPERKESEKKNTEKPDDRQEGLPVRKDESDTAAASRETKKPVDKGPVILPREEGKAEGHRPVFTQKGKHTSAFSSLAEPSIEAPPAKPPIERPQLDKKLSIQVESKSKGRGRKPNQKETQPAPNKDADLINEAETKYVEESEKPGSKKTNQAADAERETTHEFPPTDGSVWKATVSPSGGKVGAAAGNEGITKEEMGPGKDTAKPEATRPEPASQSPEKIKGPSALAVQTQGVSQDTRPENASVCAITESNEAARGSKGDKKPWKVATATNLPPEPQTQSAESAGKETKLAAVQGKPWQPKSVSVEKTENSLDDSCAHGANDAELSSTKPITKATTAVDKGTVKVSNNPPVLIAAQSGVSDKAKTGLYGKEGSSVSASRSVKAEEKDSVAKALPSEVSGDVTRLSPLLPQPEKSKSTQSKSGVTSLTDVEKASQRPPEATSFSLTFKGIKKSVGGMSSLLGDKVSPVANGEISPNSQVQPTEEKPIITKPSQSPKTPTSPEVIKLSADSFQRSSRKKLQLPRGLKDDSSGWQDAPSSWLDVDFPKRKQKVLEPKLTSAGSESNLLDTPDLDDDDFIQRIKNLCAPFSLPPRKHNPIRPPQPPFAMPAIREDRFEKVFDPEEFTIGLRKKTQFTLDTSQSLLSKLQISEPKSVIKPARASITDRCSLLSSLDTHARLAKTPANDDEGVKEETDDLIRVKSRLEGSCVLSSLTSSSLRGRRNGARPWAEGTDSGDVSPTDSPQVSPPPVSPAPPPSPTNATPFCYALGNREEAQPVVCDSGAPLPAFDDLKLPDYLQKYLPQNQARPMQSVPGQDQVESTGKMTTAATRGKADAAPLLPDGAAPGFPGIPPTIQIQQLSARPHEALRNNVEIVKREFHKRPGKMVLFEKAQFNGQAYEIYRDLADATSLRLSPLISVKVVRGCWVLYEKPNFQGRTIALEEGGTELANMWVDPEVVKDPQDGPPMQLGSIRLAVGDYSIPHIDLFTEPEGHGRVTPYHDDTIETGSFGIPQSTASIQVHSGVWLVCSDPGFQGMVSVLEKGGYPFPEAWGFPSPFVGSLRPLKMGGFKVENPNDIKAMLYEQPGFEGGSVEIDGDVFDFCDGVNELTSVGSLKIIGGFWVGYSQPGFEGQQHILEEGEYLDRSDWGGSELLSLRPILSDFMTPHVKMFSDRDFGKLGVDIDLSVPVINMDDTGYGMKTQSIDVISGIWVVFEEPGFCGEPYVLEKGLYGSPEDWGALQHRVGSTMPVLLDDFENTAKFKVQLFSQPGFQGSVLSSEDGVASLRDGFAVASCKVLAGSWLAFEGPDFTGKVYVLEEGSYPDLRAMGCVSANAAVLSLRPVGFEFSLPSITLFERCGLRGKRVVLTDGSVNLPFTDGCGRVQSVLVEGGIWVLYEGINYRGAQILLRPGQVPDWQKFSNWQKIGSLRPLIQKQVHFRLRNRQTGLMMSVTGELDDVKLMRIQEAEETGTLEQVWFYHDGHLHCKLLEECCLSPIGSVLMAGSRVGLGQESAEQTHRWSVTPEGFVRYTHTSDLVLEIKGGLHYDKNQVILNTLDPSKLQQRWDVEVL